MKHAFIADIHGNRDALDAVLEDANEQGATSLYCLGDIVGYGAEPAECVRIIRTSVEHAVCGNHDLAAAEELGIDDFNTYAREAMLWTRDNLSEDDRHWLAMLPPVVHLPNFTIVHSSLEDPRDFHYLTTTYDANRCFQLMEKPLCFVAHTHVPLAFIERPDYEPEAKSGPLNKIHVRGRMIINPGSVGQPRNEDPRASYCIYDTDTQLIHFRRIRYDTASAANKMRDAHLPEFLAFRLEIGR